MRLYRYLRKYEFEKVYDALYVLNFSYTINNLVKLFPKADSTLLYAFIMYSISKEETVEKHIAICECLIYIDPCIMGSLSMVYWHIMRAITLNNSVKAMSWAIEVYSSDPSSPFSKKEIYDFASIVIKEEPQNITARLVLETK